MKKKYSAFISASFGSRLSSASQRSACYLATILSSLMILSSIGCQIPGSSFPVPTHDRFSGMALQPHQAHAVAKPATQAFGQQTTTSMPRVAANGLSQNSPQSTPQPSQQNLNRYPVQQATYQYPASTRPSEPPRTIGIPQNGFVSQQPFQVPANSFQGAAYQGQPSVLPGQAGPLGQMNFQQPAAQSQPAYQVPPSYQAQPNYQIQGGYPGQSSFQGQPNYQGQPIFQGQPQSGLQPNQIFQPPNNLPPVMQPEMLDIDVFVPQNPTGRFSIGGTYGSDNGLLGQIIVEENDFNLFNPPRNLRDAFTSPYAWRGGGQRFRLEAVPGADLERYLVSWSDPYFRNTQASVSLSAYLFERNYFDWDEKRVGGKIKVGRRLTPYLSVDAGLKLERVNIDNPRVGTSTQLNGDLGKNNLFLGSVGLAYDNRVFPYLTGVGTYLGLTFSQAFGDYSFSKAEVDYRNHQTMFARSDGSGRHTISLRSKLGFTSGDTPVYENFFAGGISSMRGFDYRGISPLDGGVRVGGEFQWLNSLEYNFPLTADDMIAGALFVDFGTVEEDIDLNSENFRVAPGLGLRVHLPYAGLGAPLSFDFAFPIATGTGDEEKQFSFFIGLVR